MVHLMNLFFVNLNEMVLCFNIVLVIFEITRTIYSNSERSEQFLVTDCYSWRFLISNKLEQLEFKLEKIIGIY